VDSRSKMTARENSQRYIYLKNTTFNVKKEDLVVEQFSHRRYNQNKKSKDVITSEKEVNIDNSIFTDALNGILRENGFVDTTNTVFKSKTNTMLISATISKVTFKRVTAPVGNVNAYCIAEIAVEWDLLDIYGQSKYAKKITSKSGEFASNYDRSTNSFEKDFVVDAVEDALTMSFFQFLEDASTKKLLEMGNSKKETLAKLKIEPLIEKQQTLKNAQAATVTIASKMGHGSGCIISDRGHIITNYHVVAGQKDLEVIVNTGDKYKATVLRADEENDLALVSIEKAPANLAYFKLPKSDNFEVGDEVFAIGTPKSIELSQTLSKGIISALRKLPDNTRWIQTDVSVNAGNSGGALVNKNGELLGVVNSKLMGFGVEGISFCIPAAEVSSILALE
jgi:serine protease Do